MTHRTNRRLIDSLESRQLLTAMATIDAPPVPPTAASAIVRGNVFRDSNGNGVRESTEGGQPNIRVYLDYNNNGVRDGDAEPMQITNSLGGYRFENAKAPATIPVRLLLTGTNFVQTRPTNNAARTVTTVVGGNYELESFGVKEVPPTPPPAVAVLTGIVYTDKNRNGARDTGELGRPNVIVYVDTNNNGSHQDGEPLTRTNIEGRYVFPNLSAGDKTLRLLLGGTNLTQTQPGDNAPVHASVVAGQVTQASPFGVAEIIVTPPPATTGTIRGRVFYDADKDGVLDDGELGVPGRVVYLDLDHSGTRNEGDRVTFTNLEGRYAFEKVPVGTYDVRLNRDGLMQTTPVNNGGYVANVVAGGTVGDLNFGVYRSSSTLNLAAGTGVTVTVSSDLGGQKIDGSIVGDLLA